MINMLSLVNVPALGIKKGTVVGRTFAKVTSVDVLSNGRIHANVEIERVAVVDEPKNERAARIARDYADKTTTVMEDYDG